MSEMITGYCKACGQSKLVEAGLPDEANEKVTMQCNCPEGEEIRALVKLMQNIDDICGAEGEMLGFKPVNAESVERIKEVAVLIYKDRLGRATFQIDGTTVTIKQSSKGVSVDRKKTLNIEKVS